MGTGVTAASAPATVVDGFWRLCDRLSRLPLRWILLTAVVVRLLAGFAFPASDTDPYEFIPIAENIVDGEGFSFFPANEDGVLRLEEMDDATYHLPSSYMPPLYCYVSVIAVVLGGDTLSGEIWALRGLNLLMAVGMVLALRALGEALTGSRRAGTLAALGFALYPSFVYGATQVSASNLYLPIEMLLLLLLLRSVRSGSWRWVWAAGAVMGVLGLLRGEALLVVPLAAGWLWWASADDATRTVRLQRVGLFVALALVMPGLWLARNAATFGEPALTVATSGGVNLWIGNHDGATGSQKGWEAPPELREEVHSLPPTDDFELRRDDIYRREAVEYLTEQPLDALGGAVQKLVLLVTIDFNDSRARNPLYFGPWAALAVVGVVGLRRWWSDPTTDRRSKGLVVWFLGIAVVIPVVFFFLARYRMPIESLLLIFGSLWLVQRADQARTISPSLASTVTVSPSPKVPSSTPIASRSATSR